MPTPKRFLLSDRELLRLVLKYATLTSGESKPFARMYDELVSGKFTELKDTDRLWVKSVYDAQGVGDLHYAGRRNARKTSKDSQAAAFDALPRPKRPPGK